MKLYESLIAQLKKDPNLVNDNGEVKKWVVADRARNYNEDLLELLLNNEKLKATFFKDIKGTLVFNLDKFLLFIEQKNYLNDSYTSYRNKIGLTINGQFLNQRNEVELVWPYKDCVLEGGQTKEEQKRPEIFFNQTLAQDEITQLLDPKVLTGYKPYGKFADKKLFHRNAELNEKRGLPKDTITDNLVIKGNNLMALHSLKKEFAGKIKLIYIDPPFNTDNDSFNYNDSFSRSTWLTFMRNRLTVAKELLSDDGNIFIHIDINQNHHLKIVADEVFREENFVEEIIWAYGSPSGGRAATPKPVNIHDYILHYAKKYKERKQNRVYVPYTQKYIDDWFKYTDENGRRYRRRQRGVDENGDAIWMKQYLDESNGVPLSTVWNDIQQVYADPRAYKAGNKADVEVIKEFSGGQKPERLIQRIIEMSTDANDIVLDFHLGTGTTASTAHKMNRQYIGVEQIDSQISFIQNRLSKVIKGDTAGISKSTGWNPKNPSLEDSANGRYERNNFIYLELKKYNQAFIELIEDAEDSKTLLQIWEDMKEKSFLNYNIDIKAQEANIEEFKKLELSQQKQLLCELLDKNQLYVNVSDMDDSRFETTDEERKVTEAFYSKI